MEKSILKKVIIVVSVLLIIAIALVYVFSSLNKDKNDESLWQIPDFSKYYDITYVSHEGGVIEGDTIKILKREKMLHL